MATGLRRALLPVCLLAGMTAAAAEAEVRVVTATDVRAGPGAFHQQSLRLLPGATIKPVEQRGGWVLAEVQSRRGWIPAYTLESTPSGWAGQTVRTFSKSLLRSLSSMLQARPDRARYLTTAQASLGIRGFAGAYASHRGQKPESVDASLWEASAFPVADYQGFVAKRFSGRDWEALKRRLPLDRPAPLPDPDADRLGAALATALARENRLRRDPALEAYLSLIATLVAESSHAYELPVRVYLIDSPKTLGFVTPNGIVFVSTGALRKMRSEAEFAFFVGHEIAHIAFGHGPRKLQRDESRQREAGAFEEMESDLGWDERTDDKYVRTSQELTEMADQIHEYFQSESNDADELQADYWGLIYAARAGYVPEAAESVLLRIAAEKAPATDSKLLWRGVDAGPRLQQVRRVVTTVTVERSEFRSFEAEFQAQTGVQRPAAD